MKKNLHFKFNNDFYNGDSSGNCNLVYQLPLHKIVPFSLVYEVHTNYLLCSYFLTDDKRKMSRIFCGAKVYNSNGYFLGEVLGFYSDNRVTVSRINSSLFVEPGRPIYYDISLGLVSIG